MKTLLCLTCLSVAGLALVSRRLPELADTLTPRDNPEALALGVEAITGQLTERRLRELERHLARELPGMLAPERAEAQALPLTIAGPPVAPERLGRPRVVILEGWGDESGQVWVRLEDGRVCLVLASGELAPVSTGQWQDR